MGRLETSAAERIVYKQADYGDGRSWVYRRLAADSVLGGNINGLVPLVCAGPGVLVVALRLRKLEGPVIGLYVWSSASLIDAVLMVQRFPIAEAV